MPIKILQAGDRERAYSPEGQPVEVTYAFQNVTVDGLKVSEVLVGLHPDHPNLRVMPAQSVAKIAAAKKAHKEKWIVVEVPRVLDDVVSMIAAQFGAHVSEFRPFVVRHYLWLAKDDKSIAARFERLAQDALAQSKPTVQFKVRVSEGLAAWLWHPDHNRRGWHTALVRGAIMAAKADLLDRAGDRHPTTFEAVARAL